MIKYLPNNGQFIFIWIVFYMNERLLEARFQNSDFAFVLQWRYG